MKKKRSSKLSNREESAEQLPNAELEVMACLWRHGNATAAQIRDDVSRFRPMAHGSVLTLLKRLTERGLVAREKGPSGKAFVYRPTRRPEPTYRRLLQNLTDRVFGGNRVEMLTLLLDSDPPTREELQEMKRLLDELRARRQKK